MIPLKRLDHAKLRLTPAFGAEERRALMRRMIDHVAATARDAEVGPVVIASSDPEAELVAASLGVSWVSDGARPWNDGLIHARAQLRPAPSAILYLAGDLPNLTRAEVVELSSRLEAMTVVVGRAHDGGTNALGVRPADAIDPAFGVPASAGVHADRARQAGLALVLLDLPGVAFDIDTPEDARRAGLL
jgi:2-phospho-L-lactate/phosphoenolpyruvate guanylyltransferase